MVCSGEMSLLSSPEREQRINISQQKRRAHYNRSFISLRPFISISVTRRDVRSSSSCSNSSWHFSLGHFPPSLLSLSAKVRLSLVHCQLRCCSLFSFSSLSGVLMNEEKDLSSVSIVSPGRTSLKNDELSLNEEQRRENQPIDSFYLNVKEEEKEEEEEEEKSKVTMFSSRLWEVKSCSVPRSIIRDLTDVSQSIESLFSKDSLLE